jgi:hypothetical protein
MTTAADEEGACGGHGPRPVIHEESGPVSTSRTSLGGTPRGWRRLGLLRERRLSAPVQYSPPENGVRFQPALPDARVIHPAARRGPECRAGLGAQSSGAAVLCRRGQTFMRARPSGAKESPGRGGAFKWCARLSAPSSPDGYAAASIAVTSSGRRPPSRTSTSREYRVCPLLTRVGFGSREPGRRARRSRRPASRCRGRGRGRWRR